MNRRYAAIKPLALAASVAAITSVTYQKPSENSHPEKPQNYISSTQLMQQLRDPHIKLPEFKASLKQVRSDELKLFKDQVAQLTSESFAKEISGPYMDSNSPNYFKPLPQANFKKQMDLFNGKKTAVSKFSLSLQARGLTADL